MGKLSTKRSLVFFIFLFYNFFLFFLPFTILAQQKFYNEINKPIEPELNPDGTVKKGTQGSFKTNGMQVITKLGEQPKFIKSNPNSILENGFNADVSAIAIDGNGNVYVGGDFTQAGGNPISYIAKWDGNSWSALGSGTNSGVYAIAISGSDVYAGGWFTQAGGNPANYIAKWDGSSWSTLGNGTNSAVGAIAISGSDVYAGGQFTQAGGNPAKNIAKWNGSSWSALGSGMDEGGITKIAVSGNDIIVCGAYHHIGGIPAEFIAKWNGSNWSTLGSDNLNSSVFSIAISGSDIYVGGYFTQVGGISASHIAKWNGTSWSALGLGLDREPFGLAISGSDVYAVGWFTQAGGASANYIAKWNGSSWSPLGTGLDVVVGASAHNVAIYGNDVYVVGNFTKAGGNSANYIAKWNGSSWSALVGSTYTISGTIYSGGNPLSGVSVSCPGAVTTPVTTDATGTYSFTVNGGGNYTITPTKAGITFSPTSQTFNNISGNLVQNFYNASDLLPTSVTDVDGNVYSIVTIGTQVWMVENLKTTRYRNGEPIPNVIDNTEWSGLSTGAYSSYNNDINNVATYGRLYNWYAVGDGRNLAPTGWHVPTDAEWTILTDYLGGIDVAGGKLKETGTTHWESPNTGATNETGFTALPGGYRNYDATFSNVGAYGGWWSSSEFGTAWNRGMYYGYSYALRSNYHKSNGFSVRCVWDRTVNLATYILSGTITSGGNPLSGVTVTLSGSKDSVMTTGTNGTYSFTVNSGGNYIVTPTKTNYSFTPGSQAFNNVTSNQTQNFTATLNTYTLTGTITSNGNPLSGVSVSCPGANTATPVTTNATGTYSFTVNAGSSYTITPTKANYLFTPTSQPFNNVSGNQVQNFAATLQTPTISLNTATLTFGNVALSSSNDQVLTITNNGNITLSISGLTITGTNSNQFSIISGGTVPKNIAAGGNAQITVRFTPTSTGSKTGILQISHNDLQNSSPSNVTLSGTGVQSQISISPSPLAFGNTGLNINSDKNITISNLDPSNALTINSITVNGTDQSMFTLVNATFPITIPASGSTTIKVRFKPTSLGDKTANLTITHTDALFNPSNVDLSGTGIQATASIETDSSSLNFGSLNYLGSSKDLSFNITNTSNYNLNISSMYLDDNFPYQITQSVPFTILPNATKTITVRLTTDTVGMFNTTLHILNNSYNSPDARVDILGKVLGSNISFSSNTIDFGNVGNKSDTREKTLTIKNIGSLKLKVFSIGFVNNSDTSFQIINPISSSGLSLNPNEQYDLRIGFSTNKMGINNSTLRIYNNSQNIPLDTVSVTGNVVPPTLSITPSSYVFKTTLLTKPADTMIFAVKNTGTSSITISSKSITGDNSSFRILSSVNNIILTSGQTDNVTIEFYPKTSGTKAGVLVISSNDILAPVQYIQLLGIGSGSPRIYTSTTSIDIGEATSGIAKDTNIIIRNDGNLTLNITDISIEGTDKSYFSLPDGNNPITLDYKQTANIKVRILGTAPGTKTAQLQIKSNDPNTLTLNIDLSVLIKSPVLTTYLNNISFDSCKVGSHIDTLIRIKNTGNAPLTITDIFPDGMYSNQFQYIGNLPVNLISNEEKNITIRFQPTSIGSFTSRLNFYSNDPINPTVRINLSGVSKQGVVLPSYFTITGMITSGGNPLSGVSVTLSGGKDSVMTSGVNGTYKFTVNTGGNYTITPMKANYTFSPISKIFSNVDSNCVQNFTSTLNTYTITGSVTSVGNAMSGITVTLSGSKDSVLTTTANGTYSFTVTALSNYTVTPTKINYTFNPISQTFNNVTSNQTQNFTGTINTYTIIGTITVSGNPLSGVTVTLSDGKDSIMTTGTNGNYSFTVNAGSNYTVTPTRTNYTFIPINQTFNNVTNNQTQNFTATFNTFTITGTITSGGTKLSGVSVTCPGANTTTPIITDTSGTYSFTVNAGGNYTVTPTKTNYTFNPINQTFNNVTSNQTQNFVGTLNAFTISGTVTFGGNPLIGVSVSCPNAISTTPILTDATGNYSFSVVANSSYTVTPTKVNYTFTPTNQTFNNISSNQTQNFTATLNTYTISGIISSGGNPLSGVSVLCPGANTTSSVTTDANGTYSFMVNGAGNYTVIPSKIHYTFNPVSQTFNNISNNQTQNFTAILNTYSITGIITCGGIPLSGTTITLSGGKDSVMTTSANGNYSFTVTALSNYTVTPTKVNFIFTPTNQTFNNVASNQSQNFTAVSTAVVTNPTFSNVTSAGATLGANVITSNGASLTEIGVVYSINANPTISDTKVLASGTSLGVFTVNVSGLSPNTLYHLRGYATNNVGTSYTNDSTFTTTLISPTATTNSASSVSTTSATLNGSINSNSAATTAWFEYGTDQNLLIYTKTLDQSIGSGVIPINITSNLSGLNPVTTYYYRVAGQNSAGTQRGNILNFITLQPKIKLSINTLTFDALQNGTKPPNQNVSISNGVGGPLIWNVVDDASWLDVSPSNGTDSAVVVASINTTNLTPGTYSATITFSALNSSNSPQTISVKYNIVATSIVVKDTISFANYPNASDYKGTEYILFGLPGSSERPVAEILKGNHRLDWKIYWDNGVVSTKQSDWLIEYSASDANFRFLTGRAFLLLYKGQLTLDNTLNGMKLNTNNEVEIELHSGWNMITNPHTSPILWSKIQNDNNSLSEKIYSFKYQNNIINYSSSDLLEPFKGYFFYNSNPNTKTLKIPISTATGGGLAKESDPLKWKVDISLTSNNYVDRSTYIGVSDAAPENLNKMNYRKPRFLENVPSVYFNKGNNYFATDIRSDINQKNEWEFETTTVPYEKTKLTFSGFDKIPSDLDVFLIDIERSVSMNLKTDSIYNFIPVNKKMTFKVIVGRELKDAIKTTIPNEYELSQNYPNPFNPSTNIIVKIPYTSVVNLVVYDILGKEIKTIFSGSLSSGRYNFEWDGKDFSGNAVPSGIYIYKLITNSCNLNGKMILMK